MGQRCGTRSSRLAALVFGFSRLLYRVLELLGRYLWRSHRALVDKAKVILTASQISPKDARTSRRCRSQDKTEKRTWRENLRHIPVVRALIAVQVFLHKVSSVQSQEYGLKLSNLENHVMSLQRGSFSGKL